MPSTQSPTQRPPIASSESTATLRPGVPSPQLGRSRGSSVSSLRALVTQTQGQSRVDKLAQAQTPTQLSPSRFPDFMTPNWDLGDKIVSSFRARSRSLSQSHPILPAMSPTTTIPEAPAGPAEQPASPPPASWWGRNVRDESLPRPWSDPPKRKGTVPSEQTDSWGHTRKRVTAAVTHVLGTTLPVMHETLALTSEFLDLVPVPVPGLQVAAKLLLNIWDNVQGVDLNRLACLRLTERCAEILLSVREEIKDAGEIVGNELQLPIQKLVSSFTQVHNFMVKQANRPFLKRYLKRDEILRDIAGCDKSLGEALGMFGLSIQIRILKQVQAVELSRQSDTRALLETVLRSQQSSAPNALQGLGITLPADTPGLPPSSSHKSLAAHPEELDAGIPSAAVLPTIHNLHTRQNTLDLAHDTADLRTLMRDAVYQNSDAGMIRVLQVGREEFPEALKTLQRALEREGMVNPPPSPAVPLLEVPSAPADNGSLGIERSISASSSATNTTAASLSMSAGRDVLDREFMESGIDALRRLSRGGEMGLPSWTITRFEVDRDFKIGMGFFSDVYRGTWRKRTVAIKVLAECTPRDLFIKEVEIWKEFRHPHVLELYGASGASGEGPWFFVCPYEKYGCLSEFLRKMAAANATSHADWEGGSPGRERFASFPGGFSPLSGGSVIRNEGGRSRHRSVSGDLHGLRAGKETDLLRFMHEIAKGMDYLHSKGVLHGDLKASNILVDDRMHCLVSDFGQSEMKSEVYRISGTAPPHGTLRWQSPELMSGHGQLTTAMDVYSYAMCCVEILTMGRLPWPSSSDDDVRYFILKENTRPTIPPSRFSTPGLQELLRVCWHKDPFVRPSFSHIVKDVKQLRKSFCGPASNAEDIPSPRIPDWQEPDDDFAYTSRHSPDMHPIPLPRDSSSRGILPFFDGSSPFSTAPNSANTSFYTARDTSQSSDTSTFDVSNPLIHASLSYKEDTVATPCTHMTEGVLFTPSSRASSSLPPSNVPHLNSSEEDLNHLLLSSRDGSDSPAPQDHGMSELRNERRYRLLLSHEFHPSLTLPLWSPSPVSLGAVGYLSKPSGAFVTIFNCLTPEKSATGVLKSMPSVLGYGQVTTGYQRQDKRNAAQRGFDAIAGLLTFKPKSEGPISQNVSRRYSFPLRTGHKAAYLCTETTMYRYVENLDAPKKWFKANVDSILQTYGPIHHVQKEDLFLVIGTLSTPDYGLFVSHKHPDGQAHFNVFSSAKASQPWGTYTTDTGSELAGPCYHEPSVCSPLSASKISTSNSTNSNDWDTVLVARLRFKPDVLEPTSLSL
ncbi:kinase domain-containing protein [Favolaschia claudopus]|uniref:Kinase domain-containing protein n=1 Tax=Favolaschia claudopus TaxID=2862362 RepID=A0AAW0A9A0_9AGAR